MTLRSLADGYRAAVFGASGGLGAAFVRALERDERCSVVHAGSRLGAVGEGKTRPFAFDLEDEGSIRAAAAVCSADGLLHLVIVATGLLHDGAMKPEKSWRSLDPQALQRAFAINAIGPALIGKYAAPNLAKGEKSVFAALSARVGSISDNRLGGWHAYRASKAALNMLVRNLAIELTRVNPDAVCVTLHPGTVDTALSKPFQAGVREDKLFTPDAAAAHLLEVTDKLAPEQSGRFFAWDGAEIAF